MEKRYCVIGDPIAHSLSPAIYNALFSLYGFSGCSYTRERVTKETLPAFIASVPERGIFGFNVTMPLKEAVIPYLSYRDPSVVFGANTVVADEPFGLSGWSTDARGFERSLELNGSSFSGAHIVFIGCGGAARALIRAAHGKAASIVILNRTPEHAAMFAGEPDTVIAPLADVGAYMAGCTILVNATPLGMAGVAADFGDLAFLAQLPPAAIVCDLIYDPPQTRFLTAAAQLGHRALNGLWMLIWQAFYAFEKFTGILPDMKAFDAVRAALSADLHSDG